MVAGLAWCGACGVWERRPGDERGGGDMGARRVREATSADDVVLRGPSSLARLLLELDEQWPILRFLGFGIYYAWIWLCYDSAVLLPGSLADVATTGTSTMFAMYLASTTALGLTLVLAAAIPAVAERFVRSKGVSFCLAAMASLATMGVKCFSVNGPNDLLFMACCVLTGIGTAWVCLRLGMAYASVPSRQATMYASAAFFCAALLYFLARGLPEELGLIVMALLPMLASLCTMTPVGEASVAEERPRRDHLLPHGFFWRLIFAIVVFSVVVGVTRGFTTLTHAADALADQGAYTAFGMGALALALYGAVGALGNDFDISKLYYPAIILTSVGILVVPLVAGGEFGGAFIGVAYACFIMMMWCLFAHVAHVTGISPVRVFGLGRGASALGTTVGWLLGSQLIPHQEGDASVMTVVSVVLVFALLIVSMLVFNDRAIGMALRTVGRCSAGGRECGLDEASAGSACLTCKLEETVAAFESGASSPAEASTSAGVPSPTASGLDERPVTDALDGPHDKTGSWTRSCLEVARRFGLSQRETDVLFLLAKGRTISIIADELSVSFNTAKSHIRHVYVKTGVHTRQELLDMVERGRR